MGSRHLAGGSFDSEAARAKNISFFIATRVNLDGTRLDSPREMRLNILRFSFDLAVRHP